MLTRVPSPALREKVRMRVWRNESACRRLSTALTTLTRPLPQSGRGEEWVTINNTWHYIRGSVTPFCPMYFPARSA
jgi:hypothetical protein